MAAHSLNGRLLGRLLRLGAGCALLVAFCSAPALAEDPKVWRALTEGERRGKTSPGVPGPDGTAARPTPRDSALVSVVIGIAVAVCLGVAAAAFTAARRPRAAVPTPAPEAPGTGNDLEDLWKSHLDNKRRPGRAT